MSRRTPSQSAGAPAPSRPQFNAEQLRAVLQNIAGKADVLSKLLTRVEIGTAEEDDEVAMMAAANLIATTIGALADDACGGSCIGDLEVWEYGRHFADLGKAGAA